MARKRADRRPHTNRTIHRGSGASEASQAAPSDAPRGPTAAAGLFLVPGNGPAAGPMRVPPASFGEVDVTFTDVATGRADIRDALIAAIAQARRKVLFASFLFSDQAIVRALCATSERMKGGVYVITALGRHMQADLSEPDAEEDRSAEKRRLRQQRHEALLREMARAGVWLRSSEDAHAKLCVVDDELCAVTSANATSEAYERNPELALIVRHPAVARDLGRLFARVWLHRSTIDSEPGVDLNVQSRTAERVPNWTPLSPSGDVRAVATLGADERSLRAATVALIESAERELCIATYSVVAIEDHPVGRALRAAARRGVQIRLVLQPNNRREDQRSACGWLVRGAPDKVLVRGLSWTHSKAIVADGARALVWTGNLDGRHGYESGFEVGIATERPALVESLRAYVTELFERAPWQAVLDPALDFLRAHGIELPAPTTPSEPARAPSRAPRGGKR